MFQVVGGEGFDWGVFILRICGDVRETYTPQLGVGALHVWVREGGL